MTTNHQQQTLQALQHHLKKQYHTLHHPKHNTLTISKNKRTLQHLTLTTQNTEITIHNHNHHPITTIDLTDPNSIPQLLKTIKTNLQNTNPQPDQPPAT